VIAKAAAVGAKPSSGQEQDGSDDSAHGSAGVMTTACPARGEVRKRGSPDAVKDIEESRGIHGDSRDGAFNRTPVRDRPGYIGSRKGP